MGKFWSWLQSLFGDGLVKCDVCGKKGFRLKWGGIMHHRYFGTGSVDRVHYIRGTVHCNDPLDTPSSFVHEMQNKG